MILWFYDFTTMFKPLLLLCTHFLQIKTSTFRLILKQTYNTEPLGLALRLKNVMEEKKKNKASKPKENAI